MRKTLLIAVICFLAPIAVVVAMNPEPVGKKVKEFTAWAKKTFPEPKPAPKPQRY